MINIRKIGSMKVSEEVMEMLTKIGMRPAERINQREIEKEWEGSEVGEVEEREVNELLLEIFKLVEFFDRSGWIDGMNKENVGILNSEWNNFDKTEVLRRTKNNIMSWEENYIRAWDKSFRDASKNLINKLERMKKLGKYIHQMNLVVNKLSEEVFKVKDMVKDFGLKETKELLIKLHDGLRTLASLAKEIKMNDFDWQNTSGIGSSGIYFLKDLSPSYTSHLKDSFELNYGLGNDYDSNVHEGLKAEKAEFDRILGEWLRGVDRILESMVNIGRGYNYNVDDLFRELKPMLLGIHKKEYKFDIKSLFSSYFGKYEDPGQFGYRIWNLYDELLKIGVRKDYIFNLIKELEKLGIEKSKGIANNILLSKINKSRVSAAPEKLDFKFTQRPNLLQGINEAIKIESISVGEMAKIILGDLHAWQRLIDRSPEIFGKILGTGEFNVMDRLIQEMHQAREVKKIKMRGEEVPESLKAAEGGDVSQKIQKEMGRSCLYTLESDVKKVILNFIMNDFDKMVCIDFMKKFLYGPMNDGFQVGLFFKFYGKNIAPINLNLLRSGKLNKYREFASEFHGHTQSILEKAGINTDDKLFNGLKRFKLIERIFHNNDLDRELVGQDEFKIDKGYDNLFLSMLNSKWDLDQDVVNKLINVGLNKQIDLKMSQTEKAKEIEAIANHIGINLNNFRNDLIEIRQILVNGSPIPSSMKEKIYRVDNDLNNLLNGELILKYADKAEPKRAELFELNYDLGDGLRFQVLPDKSIEHFYVGAATQCCQRAGGPGESSMVDSFINGDAGVVVLRKGKEIISQSYFHYAEGEGGKGYILDNVESNMALVKKYGINLDNLYVNLAMKVKSDTGVDYFKCGAGYNKLNNSNFGTEKMKNDPRKFHPSQEDVYVDFNADESHLNLLAPKFEVKPVAMKKSASRRIGDLLKVAGKFYEMVMEATW